MAGTNSALIPMCTSSSSRNPIIEGWEVRLASLEGWIRQVIRARTGQPHAVEDIYQQLSLIVCERIDQLREVERFAPWVYRIAVVLSARHCRTQFREQHKIQKAAIKETTNDELYDPLRLVMNHERLQIVRQCLEYLAPRDREIITLKYEERFTYKQLAHYLGITERAVDKRLTRARMQLRTLLAQRGVTNNES